MTPCSVLFVLAGLSPDEGQKAVSALSIAAAISWLRGLISRQEQEASRHLAQIDVLIDQHGAPDSIELGFPADDAEAQALGWPCAGAWCAMAARVIAKSPVPVVLVHRRSTMATVAAADAHKY